MTSSSSNHVQLSPRTVFLVHSEDKLARKTAEFLNEKLRESRMIIGDLRICFADESLMLEVDMLDKAVAFATFVSSNPNYKIHNAFYRRLTNSHSSRNSHVSRGLLLPEPHQPFILARELFLIQPKEINHSETLSGQTRFQSAILWEFGLKGVNWNTERPTRRQQTPQPVLRSCLGTAYDFDPRDIDPLAAVSR